MLSIIKLLKKVAVGLTSHIENFDQATMMDFNGTVDVFSRGSLQLTFELLRKSNPELALTVRNVAGGDPLPKQFEDNDRNTDHFRINLDSKDIRAVVEELMAFTQPGAVDINNPAVNIMARSLMQDWLLLAHQMVTQLPMTPDPMWPSHPPGG